MQPDLALAAGGGGGGGGGGEGREGGGGVGGGGEGGVKSKQHAELTLTNEIAKLIMLLREGGERGGENVERAYAILFRIKVLWTWLLSVKHILRLLNPTLGAAPTHPW